MINKTRTGILIGAVLLVVGVLLLTFVPAIVAQDTATILVGGRQGNGTGFVDADGDGICDNCGSGLGFVDADGDGICDNCGSGLGFVDANGDGICDNYGSGANRGNRGNAGGGGWGRGRSR